MQLKAILLDLDGTIYRGSEPIPGAKAFLRRLDQLALPYLILTNNSTRTPAQVSDHLQSMGIVCPPDRILTSSQAAAAFIGQGRVYCIGEDGLQQALQKQGIELAESEVSHVAVGMDRGITYAKIERAARLIRAGALFIGSNPDRCFPNEGGISPGNGAILAAIAATADQQPTSIGKPERAIVDIALARLGVSAHEAVLIGDNLETDIPAGVRAGVPTVFLLTGVSSRADLTSRAEQPTWIAENYAELNHLLDLWLAKESQSSPCRITMHALYSGSQGHGTPYPYALE